MLRRSNKKKPIETEVPSLDTAVPATPAVPHRKPMADLYTVLLVIALLAILVGILFLYLENSMYDFKFKGGPTVGMLWQHAKDVVAAAPAGTGFFS